MSVSVGFDDIDLNSDVVPDERSGGVHGVNASESTVGSGGSKAETPADGPPVVGPVKKGLGSVDREDNTEAEVGHMERRTDAKLDDRVVGDEIGLNDGAVRRDSTCCEKNSGDVEMNFSTFPEEVVVDRGGESISTRDEVEGEVAAVSFMCCGEEGEDRRAGSGLAEVELNTGSGGAVVLDPVYGDTIPMQTEVASGCVQGGVKPDQLLGESSNLVTAGEWKLGNGIENEGTEVHCDTGIPTHLEDDRAPHINGFGSYGNQGVVTKAPKDIQQPQGMEIENVKQADLKPEYQVEECRTEKEGQFRASGLVWGKVRSHPWWPGQIFDPSDASEKARRYCKKDGFLIAYFGDKTFAWNEASRMKPFQKHFSQMEKQSNTEAFCHAVDCALEEVSRRVEFGLACSCLSEEVYDKLKTQFIVNAGIREESSRRDDGDDYSSAVLFKPVNVVQYLKALALSPYGGTDRLEFVIARAQLLAFNRRKGFCRLPEFEMLGGSLEDGADIPVKGERKYIEGVTEDATCIPSSNEQFQLTKGKSVSQDTSSRKGREISGDGVPPSKKERCLSDLTTRSRSHSNMSNGEGEPEGKAGRHLTSSSSVKKRKAPDSGPDNSRVNDSKVSVSPVAKKQFSRVGESIRRVANQLAMSSPIVKDGPKNTTNKRPSRTKSEKSQRRKVIAAVYPPPEEMLSQLYMASRDPMQGYDFLTSSVSFFSDFRNSCSLENYTLREQNNLTGEGSGKNTGKKLPYLETTETSWFEGMEDSYWTDMIIQSNTGEQVLFEPEIPNVNGSPRIVPEAALESGQELDAKKETDTIVQSNTKEQVLFKPVTLNDNGSPAVVPEAALESGREFDSKQENAVLNCESDRKPAGRLDEKCEEEYKPTALILNFADLESVPSESHLNNIFSRYGPLNESDTEVLKKSKRAKVIFKRRSDAETAFSSSGKFNTFGPSLVSYRLNYLPSTQRKTTSSATKRSKKGATSVEGNGA